MDSVHKKQFIRYVIAGLACVALEVALFSFGQYLGLPYLLSNSIGFIAASILGYFLQKYFTFQNTSKNHLEQGLKFAAVLAWGYVFGSAVLYLLISIFGWEVWFSKGVQLVCVMGSNYLGQHFFTFRKK